MIIKIDCTKPAGVSNEELAGFIFDAISSWGGQFHPGNPLFNSISEIKSITVHGKVFTMEGVE